jgi:hypothetical protein
VPCVPSTCADIATSCGRFVDNSGNLRICGDNNGACQSGFVCTGGACKSCTPKTCGSFDCGAIADGCGGVLVCGSANGGCPSGQSCVSNTCKVCAPKNCAELGKSCGSTSDGCGHTLQCGGCAVGQVCLSNNTCWQPLTCNTFTGSGSDGCGGYIECQG